MGDLNRLIDAVVDERAATVTVRGGAAVRTYPLGDRQHRDWLRLFDEIAGDFGTKRPGREHWTPPPCAGLVEPLLTHNIGRLRDGYGDPAVLRTDVGWHLVATSNDAPDSFPILHSPNLIDWAPAGFAFPEGHAPAWTITGENLADFWAPELHRVDDGYWLVFTARDRNRELCIGLARAPSPEGPYLADPEPLLTGGMIDPHLFVRRDGSILLFWKRDSNAVWPRGLAELIGREPALADRLFSDPSDRDTVLLCASLWRWARTAGPMEQFFSLQPLIEVAVAHYDRLFAGLDQHPHLIEAMRTPVYAQQLSVDGNRLVGDRRTVLVNDLAWEGHLIEGGWATEQQGRYYLFYSGNDFSTPDYGIGVAIADDPLGPYVKMPEPLLRTTDRWWGPGHPSVAPGPDGVPRLFFHAFPPGTGGYKAFRALLSARLRFHADRVELLPPQASSID